jgi:Cu-Zn family superoxide dismutase
MLNRKTLTMKKLIFSITILSLCLIMSCKSDKKETEVSNEVVTEQATEQTTNEDKTELKTVKLSTDLEDRKIRFSLDSKSGSTATGNVVFSQNNGIVSMLAILNGLSEGTHAIHIHEKADCSSDDGKSSGGHWNPTGKPHGKWGTAEGYHKGDIGNFEVGADGIGKVSMKTNEWCIGCGDPQKDILGKAIIVHQGTDDYTSQPSGAAGKRVSCGGIIE